jgi:hypothetical protein
MTAAITAPIGVTRLMAAMPPIMSTRRISSVAYATDESASDDSTRAGDLREAFVMREPRGDGRAHDQALHLTEKRFVRHRSLQCAGGVS